MKREEENEEDEFDLRTGNPSSPSNDDETGNVQEMTLFVADSKCHHSNYVEHHLLLIYPFSADCLMQTSILEHNYSLLSLMSVITP